MNAGSNSAAEFLNAHWFEVYADHIQAVGGGEVQGLGAQSDAGTGGGALSSQNKMVQNKSALNKNKNKNKNKANYDGALAAAGLIPALEMRRLHQLPSADAFTVAQKFAWECLDIILPPGPDYTRLETAVLLAMQKRDRERMRRLPDIEAQAALSVDEFLRPLGIEAVGGYAATARLWWSRACARCCRFRCMKAIRRTTRSSAIRSRLRSTPSCRNNRRRNSWHGWRKAWRKTANGRGCIFRLIPRRARSWHRGLRRICAMRFALHFWRHKATGIEGWGLR